ncbi:MAG: hypothetical protein GEU82_02895 [Luteitalea sp.]|nr:hypothetical protein [Luteitalea sp.]
MPFRLESRTTSELNPDRRHTAMTPTICALLASLVVAILSPAALAQSPVVVPPPAATAVRVLADNEPAQIPAVAVSPASVPLAPGAVQRFTALVTGTANKRITWTATGGTIASDGTYTAGPTAGTFKVTGTIAGGTVHGSAAIAVSGAALSTSYLSDRSWTSMTNGWGPVERDMSNGEDAAGDGGPLTINGITYSKGLGAHGASAVRYALDGACSVFTAVVGVDDETAAAGTLVFEVWADGVKRFDSGVMTGAMPGASVNVSVAKATELSLIVTDGGDGASYDHGDWADARVTCAGDASFLSDRSWTSMTNGWGPVEKDRSNGEDGAADGAPLSLNGVTYAKGLGAHGASDVRYALERSCSVLTAVVGIDDEVGDLGSAVFQVWTDGVKRYDSGVLNGAMPGVSVDVSVAGANELALIVTDGGDGNSHDHGDWANARLICSKDTTAPTVSTVTPAGGATGAALTSNVVATFSEAMTATTVTAATVSLVGQGSATPIAATISYDAASSTVTLVPTTELAGTTVYTATVKGGSAGAKDLAGNPLASDRTWTFTTKQKADTTAPTVTMVAPASGTTAAAVTVNATATFSEAMTAASVTPATVTLVRQGSTAPVAATVSYAASTSTVTLDASADLAEGTLYTATIKGGPAGVKDAAGNPMAADKVWTFTTTVSQETSYLSDRTWTSMTNGWGPVEKDRSNGEDAAGDGAALTLNGVTYAKGLGAHGSSDIRYALNAGCSQLTAVVGVDDEKGADGSVVFQVWADGVKRYDSGLMTGAMPGVSINVGISGAKDLALILTDGGDGNSSDHGDWANAQVICGPDKVAPTVTTTSPAGGATGVAVGSNVVGTFSESMNPAAVVMTLVAQGSSTPVAATVTYDEATRAVTFNPAADLVANIVYTATIKGGTAGAKDTAGNPMASDKVWSFTTLGAYGSPIYPGENIQDRVNAAPAGSAFLLKAGVHRVQSIVPKDRNTFTGEPGAILSGAKLLPSTVGGAGWIADGNRWYIGGQTQGNYQGYVGLGICNVGEGCAYPEDLFINDVRKFHERTLTNLGPGEWHFDYGADRIYIADNPAGQVIETSVSEDAFHGAATGVTIQNLVIEKYASWAQHGVIHGDDSRGWTVQDNEIRLGHAVGVRIHTDIKLLRNNIHHHGQIGVGGGGTNGLVEGNTIAFSNHVGYSIGWEAGGTKFVETNGLIVRGNNVHHNDGVGLWTDINNINCTYENNIVDDNTWMGIFHEIGYACVIRNNIVRRNGFEASGGAGPWLWGGGILVAASRDVEIYGNFVEDNADGIGAIQQERSDSGTQPHGLYRVVNLNVHDNYVAGNTGSVGINKDAFTDSIWKSDNNRFENNHYFFGEGSGNWWYWLGNGTNTFAQWQATGNDDTGTFAPYGSYSRHSAPSSGQDPE